MIGGDRHAMRGLGDRWLAGDRIEGVLFAQNDAVRVRDGRHAGRLGRVLLLAGPPPAAAYLVDLGDPRPARVAQAALEPTT